MTRKRRYPLVKAVCRIPYQFFMIEKAAENKEGGGAPKTPSYYALQWHKVVDKSKWEALAQTDLDHFIEEVKSHGYVYLDKSSIVAKAKKPSGAFLLYARDHSKIVRLTEDVKYNESLAILGRRWRQSINPVLKQSYIDKANTEKVAFETLHVPK
jgi:hypothetical protein